METPLKGWIPTPLPLPSFGINVVNRPKRARKKSAKLCIFKGSLFWFWPGDRRMQMRLIKTPNTFQALSIKYVAIEIEKRENRSLIHEVKMCIGRPITIIIYFYYILYERNFFTSHNHIFLFVLLWP